MQRKLLQLNVTANWGSTGKIAEGIGKAAMEAGWESAIAYGRYKRESESELIKVGNQADVYLHYAKNRIFDGEGLGSKGPTRRFIKWIEEYKPNVIHLHNIHDHWLNYPLLFEYLSTVNMPVVWTMHDCWAFTGGCAHFEGFGCDQWRMDACRDCQHSYSVFNRRGRNFKLKNELFSRLGRRLTVVGVSQWLVNYACESFLKDCNFHVINNGIDTETFRIVPGIEKQKMILGVSNVWPDYKGLGDFVNQRNLLSSDYRIVVVGLTEKQVKALPDGIEGYTRTSSVDELVKLYNEASVFVNPTKNDTFPTVNLEALACGTPVVTYRTGGSPEAVDEKTGIVVEKGDVQGLVNAIQRAGSLRSEDCRQRAVTHFNKDVQFGKYVDLYEQLLTQK